MSFDYNFELQRCQLSKANQFTGADGNVVASGWTNGGRYDGTCATFSITTGHALEDANTVSKSSIFSVEECIDACCNAATYFPTHFSAPCKSFDYDAAAQACQLSISDSSTESVISAPNYDYYENTSD